MADTTDQFPGLNSYIFWGDPTQGLTYEQLKQRRQIAAVLAGRTRDYPTTIGKGLTYLGESIGQGLLDRRLDAAEKAVRTEDAAAAKKAYEPPETGAKTPPPTVGPRAELDTSSPALAEDTALSRSQIADALTGGAQQSRPAGPEPIRMAGLGRPDVMPQAAPYESNYAGASPAGPGASLAEPPDQSPPAPSAQPQATPGPGPAGTPSPAPVGGGVPPGAQMMSPGSMPQGAVPPDAQTTQPPVSRSMLADAAMANPNFNLDAGQKPPAGPQLAQVGGFGPGAMGAPPPGAGMAQPPRPGIPGLKPMPPPPPPPNTDPNARQGMTPGFKPPTEAQFNEAFGSPPPQVSQYTPDEQRRILKQQTIVNDPYRSDNARAIAAAEIKRIDAERQTRFERETKAYDEKVGTRKTQYEDMRAKAEEQYKANTDPTKVGEYNRAVVDNELSVRAGGAPAAEVRKQLDAELEDVRKAVRRQAEYQQVRDAINKGVITGSFADRRIDATKFAAWLGSQSADVRATNTEVLKARLLAGVPEAVRDYKPASNVDVDIAMQQSGAKGNLQLGTIKQILDTNIKLNNDLITRYDTKADRLTGGIPGLADNYKSPNIDHIPDRHAQMLAQAVQNGDQAAMVEFDQKYGPGSAAMAINRMRLGGKR